MAMQSTASPIAVTVKDATRMSGLGRTKLYELLGTGVLKSRRIGTRRLILVSSIERLLTEEGE